MNDDKKKMFVALLCVILVAGYSATAGIKWEKNLICDEITNVSPLVSAVNTGSESVYVLTKVYPKGTLPNSEGFLSLWKLGKHGDILQHIDLHDEGGNEIYTSDSSLEFAMASDGKGNLLLISSNSRHNQEKITLSGKDDGDPNVLQIKSFPGYSVSLLEGLSRNTFLAVGTKGRDESGYILLLDGQGNILREKKFQVKKNAVISDLANN